MNPRGPTDETSNVNHLDLEHEPKDIEAGYNWLCSFGNRADLDTRVEQVRRALIAPSSAPGDLERRSVVEDRVGWYLLLCRAAIERPFSLDVLQAARVLPYISAIGRNQDHLNAVKDVSSRVTRWLSYGERAKPDATIFELLVAACYSRQGWLVQFLPESPPLMTPDLLVSRGGSERWAECKRLVGRSQSAAEETSHWVRLWRPLRKALTADGIAVILDVIFHQPMGEYSDTFLVDRLHGKLRLMATDGLLVDGDDVKVSAWFVDLHRIAKELAANYAKCGTSREIQLITGQYRGVAQFSCGILGKQEALDDVSLGSSAYWAQIDYACGAFWNCDAQASIKRKARDVRKRLAEAVQQLKGSTPSAVHVGIETLDGALVEKERYSRILKTVSDFDSTDTALDRIYCHLFGPESPPNKLWEFAETTSWHRRRDGKEEPLAARLLVVPDENAQEDEVHWERPGSI